MARIRDSLTDKAVRLLVSPLFKTWYTVIAFFLMMIGVRSVSKDKDGGKAGWRGVVWTGVRTAVVVGVVAYFWYLGG
jgi:Na+/H+-dicarboxylate symporter